MNDTVRRQIYTILILVSAGLMFGRITAVDSISDRAIEESRLGQIPRRLDERRAELEKKGVAKDRIEDDLKAFLPRLLADAKKSRPTLSANDRSRWLTIRALVEPESRLYRYLPLDENGRRKEKYALGEVKRNCACDCSDRFEKKNLTAPKYIKEWVPYAIDKAMETPGWETIDMVKHGLPDEAFDPANPLSGYLYSSKPTLLPTLMAIPYWVVYQTTGLSLRTHPYLVVRLLLVIENLLPLIFGWVLLARLIDRFGTTDWGRVFAVAMICFATFLSTFVVTLNNHLPGVISIIVAVYAASRILYDEKTSAGYFVAAGFFGALSVACELPAALVALVLCATLAIKFPQKTAFFAIPAGLVVVAGFFGTNIIAHQTHRPAYAQKRNHVVLARAENPNDPDSVRVRSFDPSDWYVYHFIPSGRARDERNARLSYWADRVGIDRGEPSYVLYAFHATVGHHGLFSLSPVWILAVVGIVLTFAGGAKQYPGAKIFAASLLGMSVVFFLFYLTRDQGDRNYGGMTAGLRWFFPLIPLWTLGMLPALDAMASRRITRGVALVLLFFSAMSVAYPLWNPWSHPWLYNFLFSLGWQ